MIEDVQALLRQVLGSRAEIARAALLKDALDYRVWAVDTRSPALRLVVKLGGPKAQYRCDFERTAAIHRLVRQHTQLPGAEVLAADETYRQWPWRYFIKSYLPGQEWAGVMEQVPAHALDKARAELGAHVAAMHRIPFAGFGAISSAGTVDAPLTCYDGLVWHARQVIQMAPAQQFFLEALEARRSLFEQVTAPGLCHEDLHKYNILLDAAPQGWRVAGILDFEKSWAGHRETDLARMDLWNMTGERFWQAYQEHYPVTDGYAARRPLYQLLWCLEFAKQTPEHLATTRSVCSELGIDEVAQFRPEFR